MLWLLVLPLAGLALYLLVRAVVFEPADLALTRVEIPLPRLPEGLDGLRLVHLSDLHLDGFGPFQQRLVQVVRDLDAPLLLLTGDFLKDRGAVTFLIPMLMEMGRGKAVYAVLGNHDHQPGGLAEALVRDLTRAGATVLVNEAVTLNLGAGPLTIAGVDDPASRRADLSRALARAAPRSPTIVLAHSPDVLPEAAQAGVPLVLAGHTHGGQICLPGGRALYANVRLGARFAAGLFRRDQTHMFITRGIGTVGLPARLFCPPEVALITLRRAGQGPA